MTPELRARLLASIEAGRLVVICGAGLSMAAPSSLLSAAGVANRCFDKARVAIDPDIAPALRDNLEELAEYFSRLGTLKTTFLDVLVPWDVFVRPSNSGHAAIADFLLCKAAFAALSANYDCLIERKATDYGADFIGAIDGDEADEHAPRRGPLLKFHNCATRGRDATIWTKSQLTSDPGIAARMQNIQNWMTVNLRGKDWLVIGFWSDWAYLNQILDSALRGAARPTSLIVVDPLPPSQLAVKAPQLWDLATRGGVWFQHVQQSGAQFLDDLRAEFSKAYLRKFLELGRVAFANANAGTQPDPTWLEVTPGLTTEELYVVRKDAEGAAPSEPAKRKAPENGSAVAALTHLLLRRAGAVPRLTWYELNNRSVRVVNGAGRLLDEVKHAFSEGPAAPAADVVICAGSDNYGLPGNVVRTGQPANLVRTASASSWIDLPTARHSLGI